MSSHNKTIAKNTIVLYIRMFIVTLISLYTSRMILKTLGVENFGIYNIAGGLISFFAVINTSMSSSVQRFLNIELGRNNYNTFVKTFNTGIEIHLLLAVAIFVLGETIGLYAYFNWLNIPMDRIEAGHYVYQFSLLSTVVAIVKTPYNALVIAKERMTFFAYISIVETVAKLLAVLALLIQPFDCLVVYAASIFAIGLLVMLAMVVYSRMKLEAPPFSFEPLKSSVGREMVRFSAWSFLGNVSNVFTWQGINLLLNIFWGVTLNAAVGVTNQVTNTISSFTTSFQVAYKPSIIQYYVKDRNEFVKLVCRASKFSFFLLFMILFPLYYNVDFVLHLWLGNVPEFSGLFVKVLLVSIIINSVNVPFYNTLEAHGKISLYQLVTTISMPFMVGYAYIMLMLDFSPVWIMILHIFISLCMLITVLVMICRMKLIPFFFILTKVFIPILKVVTIAVILAFFIPINSFFIDIFVKLAIAVLLIAGLGLDKGEFMSVLRFILRRK